MTLRSLKDRTLPVLGWRLLLLLVPAALTAQAAPDQVSVTLRTANGSVLCGTSASDPTMTALTFTETTPRIQSTTYSSFEFSVAGVCVQALIGASVRHESVGAVVTFADRKTHATMLTFTMWNAWLSRVDFSFVGDAAGASPVVTVALNAQKVIATGASTLNTGSTARMRAPSVALTASARAVAANSSSAASEWAQKAIAGARGHLAGTNPPFDAAFSLPSVHVSCGTPTDQRTGMPTSPARFQIAQLIKPINGNAQIISAAQRTALLTTADLTVVNVAGQVGITVSLVGSHLLGDAVDATGEHITVSAAHAEFTDVASAGRSTC